MRSEEQEEEEEASCARSRCWLALAALAALAAAVSSTPTACSYASTPGGFQACIAGNPDLLLAPRKRHDWRRNADVEDAADPTPPGAANRSEARAAEARQCDWADPIPGRLASVISDVDDDEVIFGNLEAALDACEVLADCRGVCGQLNEDGEIDDERQEHNHAVVYTLHSSAEVVAGTRGELAYVQHCQPAPGRGAAGPVVPEPRIKRWTPKSELPERVGHRVRGQETILIHIVSYRDSMCGATIADALRRAAHPARVFVAVVDQSLGSSIDVPCVPQQVDCHHLNDQSADRELLCRHLSQIRVHRVDARLARGPVFARHRADMLYRGETFVLQIDAHMLFTRHWDTQLVKQWESLDDEFGVLTAYPTQVTGSVNASDGRRLRSTTPVMCKSRVMQADGIIRFEESLEVSESDPRLPLPHPFFAAGLSFARGHRVLNVPYDCCLPWIFMGEEFAMAARLYTHGYTAYAFRQSAVFHYYPFEKPHEGAARFWENLDKDHKEEAAASMARIRHLVGLKAAREDEVPTRKLAKYGLGRSRPISAFLDLFGVQRSADGTAIASIDGDALCRRILSGEGVL